MRAWNKIFQDKELAESLGVQVITVRHYPKDKLEFMRLGFACKKLGLDFDDLVELGEKKKGETDKEG